MSRSMLEAMDRFVLENMAPRESSNLRRPDDRHAAAPQYAGAGARYN
jgi:hypothetical protein